MHRAKSAYRSTHAQSVLTVWFPNHSIKFENETRRVRLLTFDFLEEMARDVAREVHRPGGRNRIQTMKLVHRASGRIVSSLMGINKVVT